MGQWWTFSINFNLFPREISSDSCQWLEECLLEGKLAESLDTFFLTTDDDYDVKKEENEW